MIGRASAFATHTSGTMVANDDASPDARLPRRAAIRTELSAIARLASPIALVQFGQLGLSILDVAMVGRLSSRDLAAIALGNAFVWTIYIFGQGVLSVIDSVIARALGSGELGTARIAVQRGLALAIWLTIPIVAIGLCAEPTFRLLQQPEDVQPIAAAYALWSLPGLLPMLLFVALRQTLQAMARIRPIIVAVLATNLFNAFANWVLIFGNLGMPELGVQGAAIASSIGRYGMLAMLLWSAWPVLCPLIRPIDRAEVAFVRILPLFRMGWPLGTQFVLEYGAFSGSVAILGRLGENPVAAHKIALLLATGSFMLPLSVSMATAVRVGHSIGRKNIDDARRAARIGIGLGAALMAVCALAFWIVPESLARLFTDVEVLVPLAAHLIVIAAVFQVFDGVQVVCIGILRGAGDTHSGLIVNLIGFWGIGIPLGIWFAFGLEGGAGGFWWGLVVGLIVVSAILAYRVWRVLFVNTPVGAVMPSTERAMDQTGESTS
jgi:MATE family multidrug resistance protein